MVDEMMMIGHVFRNFAALSKPKQRVEKINDFIPLRRYEIYFETLGDPIYIMISVFTYNKKTLGKEPIILAKEHCLN